MIINKCVTPVKISKFSGHYLRNRSTFYIGVLGYIGIVQHKEHSPEVLSIPPGTPCILDSHDLGSSVGIATAYVLDGSGLEFRLWARFYAPVQNGPGAQKSSCTMGTGVFPGGKVRPRRDANPSPPSSALVKFRVKLYVYSP